MQKSKENRYKALISVVQHLVETRKLNFRPTFLFPVVSALGFMNKDMNELFKVLLTNFGDNLKKQPSRADGLSPGLSRGRFKRELRNSELAFLDQMLERISGPCSVVLWICTFFEKAR